MRAKGFVPGSRSWRPDQFSCNPLVTARACHGPPQLPPKKGVPSPSTKRSANGTPVPLAAGAYRVSGGTLKREVKDTLVTPNRHWPRLSPRFTAAVDLSGPRVRSVDAQELVCAESTSAREGRPRVRV